jgi:hypothetical protein
MKNLLDMSNKSHLSLVRPSHADGTWNGEKLTRLDGFGYSLWMITAMVGDDVNLVL